MTHNLRRYEHWSVMVGLRVDLVSVCMGLKNVGENGVKAVLRKRVEQAFRTYDTLHEVRDAVLKPEQVDPVGGELVEDDAAPQFGERRRTAAVVDGNVLLMGVPEAVGTIDGFANIVYGSVRDALTAAHLVVVAFDEPENLTLAKKEEQARRDAARKARTVSCSLDMQPCPLTDGFTREELLRLPDVHLLKANRKCRTRLYDEVMRMVFERVSRVMAQWTGNGHDAGALLLDGVDLRGCDRPAGETRVLSMIGTDSDVAAKFAREKPIGEGDLKLMALENRIRELITEEPERYAPYTLCITSTTDTDTLPIMLIDIAKRRLNPYAGSLHSVFCMRSPATKRDRESNPDARATFLACDVALLEGNVQQHLWSSCGHIDVTPDQLLNSMLAFASAAAICGCDFVVNGLKGSRFDHFYEALPKFVASEPRALASFSDALAPEPAVAMGAAQSLYRVCLCASNAMTDKPRFKRQAQTVSEVSDQLLRRSIWSTAYWSQQEHHASEYWGFLPVIDTREPKDVPVCSG